MRNKGLTVGLVIISVFVIAAILASAVTQHDPLQPDYPARLAPPSKHHWFGTDEHGRDIFARVVYGARLSLVASSIAVGISTVLGLGLGLTTGYFGGIYDTVVSRILDALFGFPVLLMAIAIVMILGPSLEAGMIAIGIHSTPRFARVARAAMISERENEYVEASRAVGSSWAFIIFRSILPNAAGPLLVLISLGFADAILNEAALSFLGLGAQPPAPSWGVMLSTGRRYLFEAPWYSFFPGGAIFLVVLSLNLIGDGLQDLANPRHR
jgi:peptide/nickel transport system permease protein